ncbi:hypothetical protein [Rhizobium chutanense]|uniref:hypothetical protein n=1 Tax=Rhizobium chutanense TaxID=2035448 RepID=UPI001FDFA9B8|nr:hypothetical protein [Rhizobium chutanense]
MPLGRQLLESGKCRLILLKVELAGEPEITGVDGAWLCLQIGFAGGKRISPVSEIVDFHAVTRQMAAIGFRCGGNCVCSRDRRIGNGDGEKK